MRILIALISFLLLWPGMVINHTPAEYKSAGLQDEKPILSFGLIADVQYCNCTPAGTRYYSASLTKLREAVSGLRISRPEFVINLGDLIERDFESYFPVLDILDSSGLKIYHLTGNHDYSVESGQKKRLPVMHSSKKGYYSFSCKGYRFVALNGNEISTYSTVSKKTIDAAAGMIEKLKEKGEPNAMDWNGGIGPSQMKWLDNQLNEAKSEKESVIIFCHFPAWPENAHNLLNYREILSILEEHDNILAWFNGHNHQGNYGSLNKIHFITLKGMVETETTGSYATVEIYSNMIYIKGNGREKSRILSI